MRHHPIHSFRIVVEDLDPDRSTGIVTPHSDRPRDSSATKTRRLPDAPTRKNMGEKGSGNKIPSLEEKRYPGVSDVVSWG